MCGIAGIINSRNNIKFCEEAIQKTLDIIHHRGPDHRGFFSKEIGDWSICCGINRLSIIDLTLTGNQPMYLDDLTIVYNGEVYNYLEIREELESRGHLFNGNSDTEVILHAFREWSTAAITKFIGMFAAAIFDKKDQKLYLFRDRVGEKPLYYYSNQDIFIFSSELKGLLVHNFIEKIFDTNMVFNNLIFNSAAAPYTILKEIKQVCPGEILTVSLNSGKLKVETSRYWNFPTLRPNFSLTEEKVLDDVEKLIYNAVKIRLRSDVPVGVFLSGGIDSSLIAAIASQISPHIKTFSIGYKDKKHDESNYAEFVTKFIKVTHTTIFLSEESANMNFEDLSYMSDDCTANISFIPYSTLAHETRKQVKVALSGDGGDEFFCGYTNYRRVLKFFKYRYLLRFLLSIIPFNHKAHVLNRIFSDSNDFWVLYQQFLVKNRLSKVKELFTKNYSQLSSYRFLDIEDKIESDKNIFSFWPLNYYDGGGNYLTDTVLKTTDRASMASSLETRPILTDHRIIEYMAMVPEDIILSQGRDKFILRKILARFLPEKFVFNRRKKGFSVPLNSDYHDKWQDSLRDAFNIFLEVRPKFINLEKLKEVLLESTNTYDTTLQTHLVFFANFMNKWGIF